MCRRNPRALVFSIRLWCFCGQWWRCSQGEVWAPPVREAGVKRIHSTGSEVERETRPHFYVLLNVTECHGVLISLHRHFSTLSVMKQSVWLKWHHVMRFVMVSVSWTVVTRSRGLIRASRVSSECAGHQPRHMDASSMSESQDSPGRMIGMWEWKTDCLHLQGPWLTLSDPWILDEISAEVYWRFLIQSLGFISSSPSSSVYDSRVHFYVMSEVV